MPPPAVNIGGSATKIFAGNNGTCVALEDETVRCWGSANAGLGYDELSYATFENGTVGDIPEEMPPPNIYVEGPVMRINGVNLDTCTLFADGHVRCWGSNSEGYLGRGHTNMVWNGPGAAVALGGAATGLFASVSGRHQCAIFKDGATRCWGANEDGQLGYGHTGTLGDGPGEMPPQPVMTGGGVRDGVAGFYHTCAIFNGGAVRCWGDNGFGALGYGHQNVLGDQPGEMPTPVVELGGPVAQLAAGLWHTCAVLESGSVRCWGRNVYGELGVGHTEPVGAAPGQMPPVVTQVY